MNRTFYKKEQLDDLPPGTKVHGIQVSCGIIFVYEYVKDELTGYWNDSRYLFTYTSRQLLRTASLIWEA